MVNIACIYTLRRPENGRAANIHIHKTCILAAHNPEAAGSSPVSATKSVTVVDTISATVIFCFLLQYRRFLRKNGDFQNISAFEQTAPFILPQPGVPQSAAYENCNRYKNTNDKLLFSYIDIGNRPWLGATPDMVVF